MLLRVLRSDCRTMRLYGLKVLRNRWGNPSFFWELYPQLGVLVLRMKPDLNRLDDQIADTHQRIARQCRVIRFYRQRNLQREAVLAERLLGALQASLRNLRTRRDDVLTKHHRLQSSIIQILRFRRSPSSSIAD